MSGRDTPSAATQRTASEDRDWLGLEQVLAEERRHLRGDATPVGDLASEHRHRLAAAEPWRALCLSGGGLRSAVFSLGVAQGLAARGALHRFDLLSTVSGGGYTGGALSAYAARLRGTADGDAPPGLADEAAMAQVGERIAAPSGPSSPFIGHLRENASYLTPRLGPLSPDLSAMLALTLRNLLIVWLVLLPLGTLLMLGLQGLAMILHGAMSAGATDARQFGFTSATAALVGWCLVLPELPLARHGERGAARARMLLLLLAPLCIAAFTMMLALPGMGQDDTLDGVRATGLAALTLWLGPALPWLPAWAAAVALLRVALRRGVQGPSALHETLRHGVAAALASAVVGLGVLMLMAAFERRAGEAFRGGVTWTFEAGELVLDAVMVGFPALAVLWLVFDVLVVGLSSRRRDDLERERTASLVAPALLAGGLWLLMCALSFGRPTWLFDIGGRLPGVPGAWIAGAVAGACVVVLGVVGVRWLSAPLHDLAPDTDDGRRVARDARIAGIAALLLLLIVVRGLSDSGLWWLALGTDAKARAGFEQVAPVGPEERGENAPPGTAAATRADERGAVDPTDVAPTQAAAAEAPEKTLHDCVNDASRGMRLPCAVGWPGEADRMAGLLWGLLAWAAIAGLAVPVNRFSMHEIYRTRVARTFLGASRAAPDTGCGQTRRPDPLTGFDAGDDLPMSALAGVRPMLLVNTALNRTGSDALAGQERRALPFSFSPLHAGSPSPHVGYRRTGDYASRSRFERRGQADAAGGLSVGTAIAMSGAATSPNMGYATNPIASFVLTLFNVRLGLWLGNPRSRAAWCRTEPPISILPLVRDMIASADDRSDWINLTDGGHFDNLGLYEMLQRRCRVILCVDGTNDGRRDLHHLARATRAAAVDMGVTIDALAVADPGPGPAVLAFRVRWPDAEPEADGLLLVLKPTLCGDEPVDVAQYATAHPAFPHESTADQFFGEGQFECYRRLGLLTARRLEDFVRGPLRAHPWAAGLADRLLPPRPGGGPGRAPDRLADRMRSMLRRTGGRAIP